MISITIDPSIRAAAPNLRLSCMTADVRVEPSPPKLLAIMDALADKARASALLAEPNVQATRAAYRKLGNDPTRYRNSAEALLRRITLGKGLYRVNNIVDINNVLSLEFAHPGGCFDATYLQPPFVLRAGAPGESYEGIGRGPINLEAIPLLADAQGPFGSTTSDSTRGMIRPETTRLFLIILAFSGQPDASMILWRAGELLEEFAHAGGFEGWEVG